MNRLYQPYLNPLKFHSITPVEIPQYISKFMDDYGYKKTLALHEEQTPFMQPWLTQDAIRLQYETNYAPITFRLYRCPDGAQLSENIFDTLQESFFNPGFYIRQLDLDLSTFPGDIYYATLNDLYITDPFEVKEKQPGTILIEYEHFERRGGIRFNNPTNKFQPSIRVSGKLKYKDTASSDIIYEDDPLNEVMIQSIPFRVFDFFVGNASAGDNLPGVPPWFIDKIKRICGCSKLRLDGRYYTKMKGSKWEDSIDENTLLIGSKHEMREALNRDSTIYDNDILIPGIAAAGLITDTKGFGLDDATNSDYIEIDYVQ